MVEAPVISWGIQGQVHVHLPGGMLVPAFPRSIQLRAWTVAEQMSVDEFYGVWYVELLMRFIDQLKTGGHHPMWFHGDFTDGLSGVDGSLGWENPSKNLMAKLPHISILLIIEYIGIIYDNKACDSDFMIFYVKPCCNQTWQLNKTIMDVRWFSHGCLMSGN